MYLSDILLFMEHGTLSMKIDEIVDASRILDEIVDSSQWLDENFGYFYCW